jgi:hypothetical protein
MTLPPKVFARVCKAMQACARVCKGMQGYLKNYFCEWMNRGFVVGLRARPGIGLATKEGSCLAGTLGESGRWPFGVGWNALERFGTLWNAWRGGEGGHVPLNNKVCGKFTRERLVGPVLPGFARLAGKIRGFNHSGCGVGVSGSSSKSVRGVPPLLTSELLGKRVVMCWSWGRHLPILSGV